jgi:hypothetical protein
MGDNSAHLPAINIGNIWAALASQGCAFAAEEKIGLSGEFRESFLETYFNDEVLRHDPGDWPVDRMRARDVIGYEWRDDGLHLREHETVTITDRAAIPGKREHERVWLLDDPDGEKLVRAFLSLVPPDRRQRDGTFGINLFRTFTNVVTKPHRDGEEFVILYVLDRIGGGAESHLYAAGDDATGLYAAIKPVLSHQLNPGEILIFDDERFIHDASPLEPLTDGTAQRDVLVCTVDYQSTYLREAAGRLV